VQEGDTVESIALSQLGDPRFADLMITINRSEILYRLVDNNKVPFVYPGQILWLPSEQELNIYRKNFFGKKSGANVSSALDSAEVTAEDDTNSVKKALHDEFIEARALGAARPRTTVRDLPQMQSNNSMHIAGALVERWQQAPGVDLEARTVITGQPRSENQSVEPMLLHATADGADIHDTVFVSNPEQDDEQTVEAERLIDVKRLSRDARVIVSDYPSQPTRFFVKLEMRIDDDWELVSTYDCSKDSAARVRFGKNGVRSTMMIYLPSRIVGTMALEDFSRNWATYRANFQANKVNNCQVDSVPPTPVDFTRIGIRQSLPVA
jgi:hypothetical protein